MIRLRRNKGEDNPTSKHNPGTGLRELGEITLYIESKTFYGFNCRNENKEFLERYQVLMAARNKMTFFWVVAQ